MRSPLAAVLSLLVVGALFAPAGLAAPPPAQVCAVCHELETDGVVVESELVVAVDGKEDSTWTSQVTVDEPTAARLAANQTRLDRLVSGAFGSDTAVDEPRDLSYTLDGQQLRVQYAAPDTVQTGRSGVVLFTGLDAVPRATINTDTLTVHGPTGSTVTESPGGTVEAGQVTWTGQTGASVDGLVAFARGGGLAGQAQTAVAIREYRLTELQPALVRFGAVPALLLALGAVGLLVAGTLRGRARGVRADDGFAMEMLRLFGAGALAHFLLSGALSLLGFELGVVLGIAGVLMTTPAVVTGATLVILDRFPRAFRKTRLGSRLAEHASALAVGVIAVWTLVLVVGGGGTAPLFLLCTPLVFLPFGVLTGTGHPARWLFPVVVALTALVAAIPFANQAGLIFVGPSTLTLTMVGWGLLGVPLFVIGRDLTARRPAAGGAGTD